MQPGCIPSPKVIRRDDHQPCGGEKQAGLRPLPCPQLQGSSSSVLGRRAGRVGATFAWAGDPLLPPTLGGEGHPPAVRRRHPPAMRRKANCCCLDKVQLSVLHPRRRSCRVRVTAVTGLAEGADFDDTGLVGRERRQLQRAWHAGSAGSGVTSDVASCRLVRAWLSVHRTGDCRVVRRSGMSVAFPASPTAPGDRPRRRTPLGRRSCSWIVLSSLQHDASAWRPVPARPRGLEWGSAGAGWGSCHSSVWRWHAGGRCRWCRGGGSQRRFLHRRDCRRHLRSDLRLFGFDGLSSPLVWGRGRGPFHSSVCPKVIAAAV
jgi:hypothetical protein